MQLDDDETRDAEERKRVRLALEAWEALDVLCVDVAKCDLAKPKPAGGWPVVCKVADTTDPALVALLRHDDIKKILRAGRNAMRTLRVPVASVTHADRTEYHGKSVVGYVIGCKGDGTPEKCLAIQKSINYLHDLGGDYAGSTTLHCGLQGTLGMQHCFVVPMAIVKPEDRCLGEGSLFGAMVYATGYHLVGQCTMPGAPDVWAPDVLADVLADEHHPLHEYAKKGVAPPLIAPKPREEMSRLTKEGKKNQSADATKREREGGKKGSATSGFVPGAENYSTKKGTEQNSRNGSYSCLIHLAEALECMQLKREPATWAKGVLKPKVLKRIKEAGLANKTFGPSFVTVLPGEEEKGPQLFCIEGFQHTKEEGTMGGPHVWDWAVLTQRGPFPTYDVAVALCLVRKGERAPTPPWGPPTGPSRAPAVVKALVERALAWSPPAPEPSPPLAKKPRSAAKKSGPPRRSARLQK